MLIRLTVEQISSFWDIIRYAVEQALPPVAGEGPDKMNNVLESLLEGSSDCWTSYEREDNEIKINAVLITKVLIDSVTNTRSLLIYSLYGYNEIDNGSWTEGYKALIKWAIKCKCVRIVGYTDEEKIIRVVEHMGGEAKFRFISLPITNNLLKGDTNESYN